MTDLGPCLPALFLLLLCLEQNGEVEPLLEPTPGKSNDWCVEEVR